MTKEELAQELMNSSGNANLSDRLRSVLCQAAAILCDGTGPSVRLVTHENIRLAASDSWLVELNEQKSGLNVVGTAEDYYKRAYEYGALWVFRENARLVKSS